jgi:hypothetical protein
MASSLSVLWGVVGRDARGNVDVLVFKAAVYYLGNKLAYIGRR